MNYGTKPVKPKPKPGRPEIKPLGPTPGKRPEERMANKQPMPFGKTPGRKTIMPVKPKKNK